MIKSLETITQKKYNGTFGKPSARVIDLIPDFDSETSMMIGDNIKSDMGFAVNARLKLGMVVLSGCSQKDDLSNAEGLGIETCYGENCADLLKVLKSEVF